MAQRIIPYLASAFLMLVAGCGRGLWIDDGAVSDIHSQIEIVGSAVADGSPYSVRVTLKTFYDRPVSGVTPTIQMDGLGNTVNQNCPPTDTSGVSLCEQSVASTVAETKTLAVSAPVYVSDSAVFSANERGYNSRACGFDFNRNGVRGEAGDCRVCDGITADPDGDGISEDLLYIDSVAGNDGTATGAPGLPFKTIAAAMAAADGPGDGAEDILCLFGTFTEAVTGTQSGVAGQYTLGSFNYPSHPFGIYGWDRDKDGVYPPLDTDDLAVVDGQQVLDRGLTLTARSQVEIAHLTFRGFRDPAAVGGGFLSLSGASQLIHLHDLQIEKINDGLAEHAVATRYTFYINTSTVSHFALLNSKFTSNGARFWQEFSSNYGAASNFLVEGNTVQLNTAPSSGRIFMVRAVDQMNIRRNEFSLDSTNGWNLTSGSEYFHAFQTVGCTTRLSIEQNNFIGLSGGLEVAFSSVGVCTPSVTQDDIVFDSNRVEIHFVRRDGNMLSNAILDGSTDSATNTIEDVRITNNYFINKSSGQADSCIWVNAGNSTALNPGTIVIAGNTCIGPYFYHGIGVERYTGGPVLAFPARNVRVFNNIFRVLNAAARNINAESAPTGWQAGGNVFDENTLGWLWGASSSSTLTGWQTDSGQDAFSTACEPSFADPAAYDFHLSESDSCARNRGVDITAYTVRDFDGDTRGNSATEAGADEN